MNIKIKQNWTLAALIGLTACATGAGGFNPARLGSLSLGMPKKEVTVILGKPTTAATYQILDMKSGGPVTREVLRYADPKPKLGVTNYYLAIFLESKLVDYGPQVGRLNAEMEGVFSDIEPSEEEVEPGEEPAK